MECPKVVTDAVLQSPMASVHLRVIAGVGKAGDTLAARFHWPLHGRRPGGEKSR